MSTSIRIELKNQVTHPPQSVAIDDSMPTALESFMSNAEWETFCKEVNKALEPILDSKKRLRKNLTIASALIVFIVGICMFPMTQNKHKSEMNDVELEIKRVLRNENNKRSNVSFTLHEEEKTHWVSQLDHSPVPEGTSSGVPIVAKIWYIKCMIS